MRYTVRKSIVEVIGPIWWPVGSVCAMTYTMSAYDVENARDEAGALTRDSVEYWLLLHSGDFSNVLDFRASIEDGETTLDFPWASEDSENTFLNCMDPETWQQSVEA